MVTSYKNLPEIVHFRSELENMSSPYDKNVLSRLLLALSPVLQSARFNSTQLSRVSFSRDPVCVWPHDVNTNTNIIYLITNVMYDVYKNVHRNGVVRRRLFRVAVDINIHGYIHVWIDG